MNLNKLIEAVKKARTVALVSHKNPDGDTIGCTLALYEALKNAKKEVHVFCDDELPLNYLLLPYAEVYNKTAALKQYDLSVSVDSADLGRLGNSYTVFQSGRVTVNIDHHKTNSKYADINLIDPHAVSCAIPMYAVIKALTPKISQHTATLLYTALYCDSGGFAFQAVDENALLLGAELVKAGANAGEISYNFYRKTQKNVFDLRLRVLNKAKFYHNDRVAILRFEKGDFDATATNVSHTDGAINTVLNIESVLISFTVADHGERQFKVSIRSKGSDIDASQIAGVFGGGGHKNAAGCQMAGHIEDVLDKLLKTAGDFLP